MESSDYGTEENMANPALVNTARDTIRAQRPNAVAEERTLDAADDGTNYTGIAGPVGPTGAAGAATGPTGPTGPA